jgi:hypothetical protein
MFFYPNSAQQTVHHFLRQRKRIFTLSKKENGDFNLRMKPCEKSFYAVRENNAFVTESQIGFHFLLSQLVFMLNEGFLHF